MNPEIIGNYGRFEQRWQQELSACTQNLSGNSAYVRVYARLVSFQAWRSELFQDVLSDSAFQFALEGQNDLLVSYLLARGGQWRSALQALRAALENYLNSFYFMDHPIEMELWEDGRFKTQFSELLRYFTDHPKNWGLSNQDFGLDLIKSEYACLSKAVHASAISFRMSAEGDPRFFNENLADLGQWETRTKLVCRGLNLLMISLFREHLLATKKRNLRKSISYSLAPNDKEKIKSTFSVTIPFDTP